MTTHSPPPSSRSRRELLRAQQLVGKVVADRWHLTRVLGVGGMATVFQAVHNRNHRTVAVKILHRELSDYEEVCERFRAEAVASNLVDHPGTVQFLDDGQLETGEPFLVMDYLNGSTIDELWARDGSVMAVPQVLKMAADVLEVLATAHDRGIIHRDIKPENIFITKDGRTKLLDFGIARAEGIEKGFVTHSGATMGTPAYMSPEQARGRWEDLDNRADIFSLAATMYALLSGRSIHQAATGNELLLAAMSEPVQPLRTVQPNVPECVAQIVDRGVAFHKEDRFDSAREMLSAVQMALDWMTKREFAERATVPSKPPQIARPRSNPSQVRTRISSSMGTLRIPMNKFQNGGTSWAAVAVSLVIVGALGLQFAPSLLASARQLSLTATEATGPVASDLFSAATTWVSSVRQSVGWTTSSDEEPAERHAVVEQEPLETGHETKATAPDR